MIRLAASNSPVEAAWAAFDAAALDLHRMYGAIDPDEPAHMTAAALAERAEKAQQVVRLWEEWRALFLGDDEPRPAA